MIGRLASKSSTGARGEACACVRTLALRTHIGSRRIEEFLPPTWQVAAAAGHCQYHFNDS